jgi:predicted GIY-YIG superfamily endonuclease
MDFIIYLLINENKNRTYVGFSDNIKRRITEHRNKKVKTTKDFGKFTYKILEKFNDIKLARDAEKYWKSSSGRRKIKDIFKK